MTRTGSTGRVFVQVTGDGIDPAQARRAIARALAAAEAVLEGAGEFWPESQVSRELEGQKARVELQRLRVEARQARAEDEPVWIEWRGASDRSRPGLDEPPGEAETK